MKTLLRISFMLACVVFFSAPTFGQSSLFYDFETADFEISTLGMVPTKDSLYVLTKSGTDSVGLLLAFNKDGSDYKLIKAFNGNVTQPNSLVGNDTVLYGSTRFSLNGGGAIFKYQIKTGLFEIIKDFSYQEAQEVEVVHITDSLIWGLSVESSQDFGSVFTIDLNGSNFKKIYNNTNPDLGQNPVDIEIVNNQIYIACNNGGGIPYPDGSGSTSYSGSVIRVNMDGTGYTNILQGKDSTGTQPRSLIRYGDFIYGFFSGRGSKRGSSIFKFNLDGSNPKILALLESTGRSDLLAFNNFILGTTVNDLFEYDPDSTKTISLVDYYNELSTSDAVCGPVFFNGNFITATQQGGPDNGGVLVKYNYIPEVVSPLSDSTLCQGFGELAIPIAGVFLDKDEDQLSYSYTSSRTDIATVRFKEDTLFITEVTPGSTEIALTVEDQDGATASDSFTITIGEVYNQAETASICNGDTFQFGTQSITESGEYSEVFQSVLGCDSTVVLTLTVNPTYDEQESATICSGDVFLFGTQSLTEAGNYTEVFQSINGCDSSVALTLVVNPVFSAKDTVTLCNGESYAFGTQSLTSAGNYTEVFEAINGCDSTVTLTVQLCVLGLNKDLHNKLTAYPNPAKEFIQIDFEQGFKGKLNLINTAGQVIKEEAIINERTKNIDLKGLSNGVYIIHLISDDGTNSKFEIIKD